MKLSKIGRISMALAVSVAMGLGMTACGGGTIGYMWVIGTQYSQIAGFKIDDYTGNLTAIPHSPFSSGGSTPGSIAVRPGGRYVYVLNKGGGGNVSVFSVGGDGVLTFQETYNSQGINPVWLAVDSTGNFLYVLDSQAPDIVTTSGGVTTTSHQTVGDITVFSIDGSTGRLTLVTNQQSLSSTGIQKTYFPVGQNPTMLRVGGGSCVFTLDSYDNTIFPYALNSANGQLALTTNSSITTNATKLTSITVNGANVYLTDAGANQILPYTTGSGFSLNTANGGAVNNLPLTSNPVMSLVDAKGKYFYVINASTINSQNPNSSISAFTIDTTTGKLQPLGDSANPYSIGSGPGCVVEDPSNQYLYTANFDGTVTGKIINQNTGQLSPLQRGSTFPATGQAVCLVVSGNVS